MDAEIIVVSGLPRSGTSLMMQMLDRAGVEVATDERRSADEDNPRGYYEIEAVRRLQRDHSWVSKMRGKALKVISQLLIALPDSEQYRVILMRRDLDEILASQAAMLARNGRTGGGQTEVLRKAFVAHLEHLASWLPKQAHLTVHEFNYRDVVAEPRQAAEQVAEFLGADLDIAAMTDAVDPALYRNRKQDG